MSLMEDIVPSEHKLATVVPIFRSGEPDKVTNYKPISVISFFSKIFKDLMRSKNTSGYFSFYVENISIKIYSTKS